jgi:hypothetical protein
VGIGQRVFALGLGRERTERALLLLGMIAHRPPLPSPVLDGLRAAGRSGRLDPLEVRQLEEERQLRTEETWRSIEPGLAMILTPEEIARVRQPAAGPGPR